MRTWLLAVLILASPISAELIDGVAASVDGTVISISELDRGVMLRLFPAGPGESTEQNRRRVLNELIEQILQRADLRRFGPIEVPEQRIENRFAEVVAEHGSEEEYNQVLVELGIEAATVRALLRNELEIDIYVDERFAPLLFVPLEDIEGYYEHSWSQQRLASGLAVEPLGEVREEIRDLLRAEQLEAEVAKWTRELRSRANVDVFVYK